MKNYSILNVFIIFFYLYIFKKKLIFKNIFLNLNLHHTCYNNLNLKKNSFYIRVNDRIFSHFYGSHGSETGFPY